jgi:hypothetical protein
MINTRSGVKYEETIKHTHILPATAESQILSVFKIGCVLHIATTKLRNVQEWRLDFT